MADVYRPSIGARVLAFHPEARAWRPATVRGLSPPDLARVHFAGYATEQSGTRPEHTEFDVRYPEELEALDIAADFLVEAGEDIGGDDERLELLRITHVELGVLGP